MLSLLTASENVGFGSALLLMLAIGALQLIGLGGHLGLDTDAHLDLDADLDAGFHADLLGWMGIGRVPLMVLLVTMLAIFGTGGLLLQQAMHDLAGGYLAPWIAYPAVAAGTVPLAALAARGLARILPSDFTTAVPIETLIGNYARITTGRARQGSPARARAEDEHGQAHYVMVEPDHPQAAFEEGETVLLVRRERDVFRAISRGDFRLPRLED